MSRIGVNFAFEDQAGPALQDLAARWPREFQRALRHLGYRYMVAIKHLLSNGSFKHQQLTPLSEMRWQRDLERLRRGSLGKRGRRSRFRTYGQSDAFSQLGEKSRERLDAKRKQLLGKLARAVQTKVEYDGLTVSSGFVLPNIGRWAAAIQSGRRGDRSRLDLSEQPVTPAMRRMFAATGRPLSRTKRTLRSPERQAVRLVYEAMRGDIPAILSQRVADILDNKTWGGRTGGQKGSHLQ